MVTRRGFFARRYCGAGIRIGSLLHFRIDLGLIKPWTELGKRWKIRTREAWSRLSSSLPCRTLRSWSVRGEGLCGVTVLLVTSCWGRPSKTKRSGPSLEYTKVGLRLRVRICLSFSRAEISRSKNLMVSLERSMEAANLGPSVAQRETRSCSALKRRFLVSILSHVRHLCFNLIVFSAVFVPHVSPIRYSRVQCPRK